VVDRVTVKDDQLERFRQLEDSLDLTLDLRQAGRSGVNDVKRFSLSLTAKQNKLERSSLATL